MIKVAIKLRLKPQKRRTGLQKLRARLYYRKNRTKIRMQRRRYLRSHRSQIKHRKLFQRFKPTWFKKPAPHRVKKFKFYVPHKKFRSPKPHAVRFFHPKH